MDVDMTRNEIEKLYNKRNGQIKIKKELSLGKGHEPSQRKMCLGKG